MLDMHETLRGVARDAVRAALIRSIDRGALEDVPEARAAEVEVSRPAKPEHGDLASNVGLKLAKPLRMPPLAIASALAASMTEVARAGAGSVIASAGRGRL